MEVERREECLGGIATGFSPPFIISGQTLSLQQDKPSKKKSELAVPIR